MLRSLLFSTVVVASVLVSALVLSTTADDPYGAWTRDVVSVESAEELIAASSVVVEGSVASTSRGRVVGEGDGALRFREIVVDISRSWNYSTDVDRSVADTLTGDGSNQIVLEIVGWDGDGTEVEHINGQATPQVGESWVMFLVEKRDRPNVYRPVNGRSMLRVLDGEIDRGLLASDESHEADPLARFVGQPVGDLRSLLNSVNAREEES